MNFCLEDAKDWVSTRKERGRPGAIIIDEFSQFDNENISALLELSRSENVSVILATQSIGRLTDEARSSIVTNTGTKILMLTTEPEEIAKLAGTILRIENTIQHREGEVTGLGSGSIQDTFAINMNDVRRLNEGEGFIIRRGRGAKLMVKMVEDLTIAEDQEEQLAVRKTDIPAESSSVENQSIEEEVGNI